MDRNKHKIIVCNNGVIYKLKNRRIEVIKKNKNTITLKFITLKPLKDFQYKNGSIPLHDYKPFEYVIAYPRFKCVITIATLNMSISAYRTIVESYLYMNDIIDNKNI